MRLIYTLAFLLIAISVQAQGAFEAFWGIPFGTPYDSSLAMAKKKNPSAKGDGAKLISAAGSTFAGREGDILMACYKGRLSMGMFLGEEQPFARTLANYDAMASDLTAKYGEPVRINEKRPSYIDRDDYLLLERSIKKSESKISRYWKVLDTSGRKINLLLSLNSEARLTLSVFDEEAADAEDEEKKREEAKDY